MKIDTSFLESEEAFKVFHFARMWQFYKFEYEVFNGTSEVMAELCMHHACQIMIENTQVLSFMDKEYQFVSLPSAVEYFMQSGTNPVLCRDLADHIEAYRSWLENTTQKEER